MRNNVIYIDELVFLIDISLRKFDEIKEKLGDDSLVNQGLFLMMTAYFEATLRDIMLVVLVSDIEKLNKDTVTIDKKTLLNSTNDIKKSVIDDELYHLFKGNVKDQLIYAAELLGNICKRNIKKPKNKNIYEYILKCSDISYYRNALIHNNGYKGKDFDDKVEIYKSDNQKLNYKIENIKQFINDNIMLLKIFREKIIGNVEFTKYTRVNHLRELWRECFKSPILRFDDYWEIDDEKDLILEIKYPEFESSISSSEKVYLSVWRHQFYDPIPTEEFCFVVLMKKRFIRYIGDWMK